MFTHLVRAVFFFILFFFFNQKTAYEMRISDWSSDVCSSDLLLLRLVPLAALPEAVGPFGHQRRLAGERAIARDRAVDAARERDVIIDTFGDVGGHPQRMAIGRGQGAVVDERHIADRKSTRLNSSH